MIIQQDLVSSKEHVKIDGYTHISQIVNETNQKLQDIRDGKLKPLVMSSKKEQEKLGGFVPGDQIVLAARTGMGKTAKVLHWMKDFANPVLNPHYEEKLILLYDSWEMAAWKGMLRFYSRGLQLPVNKILDYKQQMQQEMFNRILTISQNFINFPIYFRNISQTVNEWASSKRLIRRAYPNHTIVNIVDHTRLVNKYNEKSEEELITSFMKTGMKLKLEEDMINIFLSQMNRNIESNAGNRESIGKHLPVASDIFGADSAYQCADFVVALHRPGFYGLEDWEGIPTGIIKSQPEMNDHLLLECVIKQRDGWTGTITKRHNLAINEIVDY